MRNAAAIWKYIFGSLSVLMLCAPAPLRAAQRFEGIWVNTRAECLDDEGPNSRTLIDLRNLIDGKPSPLFDQYENHCKIERKVLARDGTMILTATCFEFWEYFTKGIEGQKATIKLSPGQKSTLKIDGKAYLRCEEKRSSEPRPGE